MVAAAAGAGTADGGQLGCGGGGHHGKWRAPSLDADSNDEPT